MKTKDFWKKNSSGQIIQYDYLPPSSYGVEQVKADMEKLSLALTAPSSVDISHVPEWILMVKKLPLELQNILISEIRLGNTVNSIGSPNWPNVGSIVVNVAQRFSVASRNTSNKVHWRNLDDPHYCREEISQKHADIEYLIIT